LDKDTTVFTGIYKQQNNPLPASLYHFFWKMMDWIYPPVCPGCESLGFRFCPECVSGINFLNSSLCEKCGQPILDPNQKYCLPCQKRAPTSTKVRSVAIYEGAIRNAILQMKFHQDFGISEYLGQLISTLFFELNWDIDLIIPVPLSVERKNTRGFNQSYRLAIPLSLQSGIPINTKILTRTINTQTQSELPKSERFANVEKAFTANGTLIQNKKILIIDDVATTSSTINACSTTLLSNGAMAVFGITAARAVL
jgi:ComF family protein